jgi:adenylylsulfate kinase
MSVATPAGMLSRRDEIPQHQGLAVWFTGLSGAGKSTLCRALEMELRACGYRVQVLDGDEIRRQLCRDLGFSKADRDENIARIGYVARLLVEQNVIVLVAAISPYREARARVREQIGEFFEVYVNASLETCMRRDPKRLYARAVKGEVKSVTGIDDPYEVPQEPELECVTDHESPEQSAARVFQAITAVLGARARTERQYGVSRAGR